MGDITPVESCGECHQPTSLSHGLHNLVKSVEKQALFLMKTKGRNRPFEEMGTLS